MKTKTILFSSLLVLLFTSCKPKYEKLIDEYMKENLHDYSSYEPISFDFRPIYENPNHHEIEEIHVNIIKYMSDNSIKNIDELDENNLQLLHKVDSLINIDEILSGYEVVHKYRATNGYGSLRLSDEVFIFNIDKTKMVSPYSIKSRMEYCKIMFENYYYEILYIEDYHKLKSNKKYELFKFLSF